MKRGFSLIEMMIVIFLMATLTTMVSLTIRNSLKTKKKLEYRISHQAHLYDAIRIIRGDIEKAFHYQDVFFEIEEKSIREMNEKIKAQQKASQPGQAPPPQLIEMPPRPQQLTAFVGEANELHFTSLNNFRTKYNAPESDQMEVGYYLGTCASKKSKKNTQCLYRRTTPYIDDDVTEGGRKMVVAEHITSLDFEYRSNDENAEWLSQWRSDNKGRGDLINKFPHQVRMKIGIHNEENKYAVPLKETVVMNIQFPNNEPFYQPQGNQQQQNGQRRTQ